MLLTHHKGRVGTLGSTTCVHMHPTTGIRCSVSQRSLASTFTAWRAEHISRKRLLALNGSAASGSGRRSTTAQAQTSQSAASQSPGSIPAALRSADSLFSAIKEVSDKLEIAGVAQFLGIALSGVVGSYYAHPYLREFVTDLWGLKPGADASFESSFFSLVGIIYGLLTGNTFLFLYERQVNIVQELYGEAFALELLLQQTFLTIPDVDARREMSEHIRLYIVEEMMNPSEMNSPFEPNSSFTKIVDLVVEEQDAGLNMEGIKEAAQKLADAQSRRSAVAAQVLPGMHWVFLHALEAIFLLCFVVFDATAAEDPGAAGSPERRLAFSALAGVLLLSSQVLHDLDSPVVGLYSFRRSLDLRLQYVVRLLEQLETEPHGFIPRELVSLQRLGLVGAFSSSSELPTTVKPKRRARIGRHDESTYAGGPLHLMTHGEERE